MTPHLPETRVERKCPKGGTHVRQWGAERCAKCGTPLYMGMDGRWVASPSERKQ